jgi:hypothetical protein
MFLRIILFLGLLLPGLAEDTSPRQIAYAGMDSCPRGGCPSPVFDKGYFFQMVGADAGSNGYALWGPEGSWRYSIQIVAPDGTLARLRDAAIDSEGSAIVPMSYGGVERRQGGLVLVDPRGRQTQFIATGNWLPAHACFGLDNAIWVSGTQWAGTDYPMVRKYARDGKLLGEYLPRSLFPPGLQPVEAGRILAAGDRIGILAYPGNVANRPEWIELDPQGKLMGRWNLGPTWIGQVAYTADGRLFAHYPVSRKYEFRIFNRSTSTWEASDAADGLPAHTYLVGADGNNLAFENRMDGVQLLWRALTPAPATPLP